MGHGHAIRKSSTSMEVLGAVAATGQLIGTAIGILDSISQLRDFLRHAPERYKGWHTELTVLSETITCIVDNSALHTCQVKCIIDSMDPKIATLKSLCSRYMPQPKPSLITRLNNAFSARTTESRIVQSLESLEHDKTTLLLTISVLKESTSTESSRQTTPEPEKSERGSQGTDRKTDESSTSSCRDSLETMSDKDNHSRKASHSVANQRSKRSDVPKVEPPPTDRTSSSRSMSSQQPTPRQDFSITSTKMNSNDSVFSNTTINGAGSFNVREFEFTGNRTMMGNHTSDFAKEWLKMASQSSKNHGSTNQSPSDGK
ncbi:hypothetical protein F5B19DRAFT_478785 [Rostrohypoxylon terebratum]|nr:hypothetical protein F5B19DRAFT_478785 [Rostrohypoxylon terebratum]